MTLPRLLFNKAHLCQRSVAETSMVGTVYIGQCSSSCDERVDTDNYSTRGHAAEGNDQHAIDYRLKVIKELSITEMEARGERETEREGGKEGLTAIRAAFLDS